MKLKPLTFYKDSVFDKCPECKSIGVLRRSKARSTFEHIVKISKVWNIYRCRHCGWRGVKANFSLKKLSFKTLLIYTTIIIICAYLIRYILTRFVG